MIKPGASAKLTTVMKNEKDPTTKTEDTDTRFNEEPVLVAGLDYYLENGLMVFSAHFLSRRGYCCDNGCRHCPYESETLSSENHVTDGSMKLSATRRR